MVPFLISLLVFILIAAVVLWLVRIILNAIPGGAPFTNIAYGIVALILLLLFLNEVGWIGSAHGWRRW